MGVIMLRAGDTPFVAHSLSQRRAQQMPTSSTV